MKKHIAKSGMPKLANISQTWLDTLRSFTFDYSAKHTVNEIAEAVNIPRRTASRHLSQLSKSNLIRMEMKGKTKLYYINLKDRESKLLINLIEFYKSVSYRELSGLWVILSEFMQFGDVILFGSYAKGYATEESDIDMLILARKSDKAIKRKRLYSKEINIHFSTLAGFKKSLKQKNVLAIEIAKSHVVFGSGEFVELCWRYYRDEL